MKKQYIKPEVEVVKVNGNALMETWSIGVDNDPNHGIGPGNEDDIGAKQGFFFDNWEETGSRNKNLWDD